VHLDGERVPRFSFVGRTVSSLIVYEVPAYYLKKAFPLNECKETNPSTKWFVEGHHDAKEPIEYGNLPVGMKEFAGAKPLAEGVIYFASLKKQPPC
jgi:hypothetical protein